MRAANCSHLGITAACSTWVLLAQVSVKDCVWVHSVGTMQVSLGGTAHHSPTSEADYFELQISPGSAAGGGQCANADQLMERNLAVHSECCDEPSEDCSSGTPASCNEGCAAVLVPCALP